MIAATVCRTCPAGQAGLAPQLREAIEAAGMSCDIRETDCMSGCTQPSTIAFRAAGKTAYLFGGVDAGDIPDLLTFLRLYADAPDGNLVDARPLGALRGKAIARIPG